MRFHFLPEAIRSNQSGKDVIYRLASHVSRLTGFIAPCGFTSCRRHKGRLSRAMTSSNVSRLPAFATAFPGQNADLDISVLLHIFSGASFEGRPGSLRPAPNATRLQLTIHRIREGRPCRRTGIKSYSSPFRAKRKPPESAARWLKNAWPRAPTSPGRSGPSTAGRTPLRTMPSS